MPPTRQELVALLRRVKEWKDSNGDAALTRQLREELNQPEDHWVRRVLERLHLADIVCHFETQSKDRQIENYRLLLRLTRNKVTQAQMIESGMLLRAAQLACEESDPILLVLLLKFMANCSSHIGSKGILLSTFHIRRFFEISPETTAMISYNLFCLNSPTDAGNEILSEMLWAYSMTDQPDVLMWLGETIKTIIREADTDLRPTQIQHLLQSGLYLNETEGSELRLCQVLTLSTGDDTQREINRLTAIAQWTSANKLSDGVARRVLESSVSCLKQPQVDAEVACLWLRITANVLTMASLELKLHLQTLGGIPLLLNNTHLDPRAPSKREWAIMAIRAACEDNIETQNLIAALRPIANAGTYPKTD